MKILVIGATGMLGKPVARELIRSGFECHLLSRNPSRTAEIFPGATIVPGDVMDLTGLEKAMQGMDAVYCNLSVLQTSRENDPQPEREGIGNILAAAKTNGIRRIAYISSLVHRYNGMNGFSWWAFTIKAAAVEKIRSSGIPYTIFYPSTFMESYPYQMLMGNKVATVGQSIAPMWFIAAEDYARQVAASFRLLTTENREYAVQGPEALTFSQANTIFINHYKRKRLKTMNMPLGVMKFLGLFVRKFNYGWHICDALNRYSEKFESDSTWKELGTPRISLAGFAAGLT